MKHSIHIGALSALCVALQSPAQPAVTPAIISPENCIMAAACIGAAASLYCAHKLHTESSEICCCYDEPCPTVSGCYYTPQPQVPAIVPTPFTGWETVAPLFYANNRLTDQLQLIAHYITVSVAFNNAFQQAFSCEQSLIATIQSNIPEITSKPKHLWTEHECLRLQAILKGMAHEIQYFMAMYKKLQPEYRYIQDVWARIRELKNSMNDTQWDVIRAIDIDYFALSLPQGESVLYDMLRGRQSVWLWNI